MYATAYETSTVISAQEQIHLMQEIVCLSGTKDYSLVRAELLSCYEEDFGEDGFECEEIPANILSQFMEWLTEGK